MSRELFIQHFLEGEPVFHLVGLGYGAQLAVGAGAEDRADAELFGAHAALGGALELHDVGVDGLGDDGRGVLLAGSGEDHRE